MYLMLITYSADDRVTLNNCVRSNFLTVQSHFTDTVTQMNLVLSLVLIRLMIIDGNDNMNECFDVYIKCLYSNSNVDTLALESVNHDTIGHYCNRHLTTISICYAKLINITQISSLSIPSVTNLNRIQPFIHCDNHMTTIDG